MQKEKGFVKVIFLIIIVVLIITIIGMVYLNGQKHLEETKEDLKTTAKNKAEKIIDDTVENGKDDLGQALKSTGEKLLNGDNIENEEKNN
jgi:flagellar basal body-associated protein FliL